MKVLVIGAGAMGSLVGGILSAEHDVTILGRPEQVDALKRNGLRIEGLTQGVFSPRAIVGPVVDETFDLIVICVKSYNTDVILEPVAAILTKGTRILSLQNGLDNEERILGFLRERSLPGVVVGGITCHGATYKGPGLVKHAGEGETVIGRFDDKNAGEVSDIQISEIADAFARAGLATDVSEKIKSDIWSKGIINSAINPLTAIIGQPNGAIVHDEYIRRMAEDIVRESTAVARASGQSIRDDHMLERTFEVAERTAANISSMLQDIRLNRRTEIDAINGAISHRAAEVGLCAPLNQTMVRLVKATEQKSRQ